MDEKDLTNIFENLRELWKHTCASLPPDTAKKSYTRSIVHITTFSSKQRQKSSEIDETLLCKRIEQHLALINKSNDIIKFQHLHRKLRRSEFEPVLTKRSAVILFLLKLSELVIKKKEKEPFFHHYSLNVRHKNNSSSSLNTIGTESRFLLEHRLVNTSAESHSKNVSSAESTITSHGQIIKKRSVKDKSSGKEFKEKERTVNRCYSSDSLAHISNVPQKRISTYDTCIVSESDLINELLYCFHGIPGIWIKLDHNNGFTIDPQAHVPHPDLALKLLELGFLHNNIVNKCKFLLKNGAVLRAVEAAVRKFLVNYYEVIASLHSEFLVSNKVTNENQIPGASNSATDVRPTTICSLTLNVSQAFETLRTICDAINAVQNTKGGAVITALNPLRHHGDPRFALILDDIIKHAERPLMKLICTWVVEGVLHDPFDEFFISINTECRDRDLWRNKFILRSALIPSVISENQAAMILRSGKAIKFLNVICEERVPIVGSREKLSKMKDVNISDLMNPRSELTEIIAAISDESSKLVLDILVHKFKLFAHFQGLRRYMLLGQGDFVNYFMDLVEPQMRKPASRLQYHELMVLLGTAIQNSNAAYEDPDVIKRVIVKILVASGGDWGSDVFGLQYLMHDSLDAALKISEGGYSQVFNFLWRTKRMESILLRLRKQRWATKNQLNYLADRFSDVNGVIMSADKLNLEFLHFARQFHYYILFEVVECLWEQFLQEFNKARSFDDVIIAHDNFIKLIQLKTFHREESRAFINQFRIIWDLVYELEALEEKFFSRIIDEGDYYRSREKRIEQYGTNHNEEAQHIIKKKEFKSFLDSVRAQYDIINRNYQGVLKKFLLALSSENNLELIILSDRIDFNDYYKKSDSRISDSMKYSFCNELFS